MHISFERLSIDWNAEPNAPEPRIKASGCDILLEFYLNAFRFKLFSEEEIGILRFSNCSRYRLGSPNDEGWYQGQCRYSKLAPEWGEFYEIQGDDPLRDLPTDWHSLSLEKNTSRHFLFYLRDHTFEAIAESWDFEDDQTNALIRLRGDHGRVVRDGAG